MRNECRTPRGPRASGEHFAVHRISVLLVVCLLAGCSDAGSGVATVDDMHSVEPGEALFGVYCAACHQPDGRGPQEGIPSLAGSPWVAGSETRLVKIVLHGVRGPIEINGKIYDREMPAFGQILTDTEVVAMLSFVRRRYGGLNPPIAVATVGRIRTAHADRTEYWTVDELRKSP